MTYRLSFNGFDGHATAIGYTCITWSILETEIDELTSILCGIQPNTDESRSITGNVDIRDKINICLALGFIRKPDDEWFCDLQFTLQTFVDNDLRNRRNRFIHDRWIAGHSSVIKRQEAAKIRKPQANQLVLETFKETDVSADEIWKLVEDIQTATGALDLLRFNLMGLIPSLQRTPLMPRLPKSPWDDRRTAASAATP